MKLEEGFRSLAMMRSDAPQAAAFGFRSRLADSLDSCFLDKPLLLPDSFALLLNFVGILALCEFSADLDTVIGVTANRLLSWYGGINQRAPLQARWPQ